MRTVPQETVVNRWIIPKKNLFWSQFSKQKNNLSYTLMSNYIDKKTVRLSALLTYVVHSTNLWVNGK
jgi:hypothetical protein